MNPLLGLLAGLLLVPPVPGPPPAGFPPADSLDPAPSAPASPADPAPRGVRPVPGAVVAGFDPPELAWSAGHRGVDLAAAVGEQVRSVLPGTVTFAGALAGRGVVVVDHGGRRTTYEPVQAWVEEGQDVVAGEVLGVLEPGAGHCFPAACLHWGLRVGDQYVDPLSLLGPRRVRLLPLSDP